MNEAKSQFASYSGADGFDVRSPAKFTVSYFSEVRSYSIRDLWDTYSNTLWEPGRHKDNVRSFLLEIDDLLLGAQFSCFGQSTIDSITQTLRERGNSNATINRKMAALSKLLRKAYKMGDIHSLPEFRRQKERQGRIRFLEPDEERYLFRAIAKRNADCHRLAIFLVDTGCRIGEALGLIWNDVQEDRVTFWLTKSGRSRTVPLTERAAKVVNETRPNGKGPFKSLNAVGFRSVWNEAKVEVGLGNDEQLVPHILRHTCASRLVQGGIDIRRVQMWLGHQTLQMTMRYAHLATNDLDSCVHVLERCVTKPPFSPANARKNEGLRAQSRRSPSSTRS